MRARAKPWRRAPYQLRRHAAPPAAPPSKLRRTKRQTIWCIACESELGPCPICAKPVCACRNLAGVLLHYGQDGVPVTDRGAAWKELAMAGEGSVRYAR